MQDQEYLSPKQVAEYLGCSTFYVYEAAKTGRLRSSKLSGKMIRIRREDVDAFVRTHLVYADVAQAIEGVGGGGG